MYILCCVYNLFYFFFLTAKSIIIVISRTESARFNNERRDAYTVLNKFSSLNIIVNFMQLKNDLK